MTRSREEIQDDLCRVKEELLAAENDLEDAESRVDLLIDEVEELEEELAEAVEASQKES